MCVARSGDAGFRSGSAALRGNVHVDPAKDWREKRFGDKGVYAFKIVIERDRKRSQITEPKTGRLRKPQWW